MHEGRHSSFTMDHPGGVVRLVQLTDTHLCKSAGGTLLGMDTDNSLLAVIDLVSAERGETDLVLATGDLSDHGFPEAYERLLGYLDALAPNVWLTGNHDDRDAMRAVMKERNRLHSEILVAGWQILMLDSQVAGEVGGKLGESKLAYLEQALASAQQRGLFSLVCLHHQPVAVGTPWLDEQMVADADRFFAVIDRYPGVRAVLWGHVHQQIDRRRGELQLLASPSTCVQFAPGYENFKADDQPPGYRWLELNPDGTVVSGVSRVRDVEFVVDLDSGGYL